MLKTIITCDEGSITLTNENLDNDNYIEIIVNNQDSIDVNLDELFSALIQFDSLRSKNFYLDAKQEL